MSENITLGTVSSFANDSSAVAIVNSNSSNIETAFTDCLSLSGGQPNAMQSNLDMNKFQVLNLPPPSTLLSPVRLTDVVTNGQIITVNTLPVGGATNTLLHKNSGVDYDATWTLTPSGLTSIGATTSTVTTSNVTGTTVYSGSSSGTTTLKASAIASGTLTIPAATDTLIGKATTDTLTNKTYDTAGTGNVFKINGTGISAITGTGSVVLATSPTLTTPNTVGTSTNNNAAAGSVGEYIESVIALGSAISTGVSASTPNLTSISLTAGDWDVVGHVQFIAGAVGNIFNSGGCSISTTTGSMDLTGNHANGMTLGGTTMAAVQQFATGTAITTGPVRLSLAGTTTVFLVATLTWNTSTQPTMYGMIRARRIR